MKTEGHSGTTRAETAQSVFNLTKGRKRLVKAVIDIDDRTTGRVLGQNTLMLTIVSMKRAERMKVGFSLRAFILTLRLGQSLSDRCKKVFTAPGRSGHDIDLRTLPCGNLLRENRVNVGLGIMSRSANNITGRHFALLDGYRNSNTTDPVTAFTIVRTILVFLLTARTPKTPGTLKNC